MTKEEKKVWTITELERLFAGDLSACTSVFERTNARAVHRMTMREAKARLTARRKLTPGETAILEEYGL